MSGRPAKSPPRRRATAPDSPKRTSTPRGDAVSRGRTKGRQHAFEVEVLRDVRIPSEDRGVTLSADLFLPVDAGCVPALVTVLPYRKDAWAGILNRENMHQFASRGYACVLVDLRGTGSSGGEQRPPFHPDEADDGVAAVEWAAGQAWCDGCVGMWGHSYGAVMAMRTAARRTPHLKAIVPVMGLLDPERDFVHPDGLRGCLSSLGLWGIHTLLTQLLPPLEDFNAVAGQLRWRTRLDETEPYVVDLFRHAPGDPTWRERVVDASGITVPSFCIGGWQDLFCAATIRAYEEINAPKRLLVGPWTHVMPDAAPFVPADFAALALPWWDRWLRGIDNGIDHEPPVVLCVQADSPRWQQYESWPPAKSVHRFATGPQATVLAAAPEEDRDAQRHGDVVIAEHRPDPTAGALGALWGVPSRGLGRSLDQHDDDMRSLILTTEPMPTDIVVVGSPLVTVSMAEGGRPDRLVVKLGDVDPAGRSTLIASAAAMRPADSDQVSLTLAPTCYLVREGHRLRVAISDADFPRLWPASGAEGLLRVTGADLTLTTVSDDEGSAVVVAPPPGDTPDPQPLGLHEQSRWAVTRDFATDGIEVKLAEQLTARTHENHLLQLQREVSARVTATSPAAALLRGTSSATARMVTGETVTVRAELVITEAALRATGEVSVGGETIWSRQWR